jgi:hypothetical protein
VAGTLRKTDSAKQDTEERQIRAMRRKAIFLTAKGERLIRTIVIMVVISSDCASPLHKSKLRWTIKE